MYSQFFGSYLLRRDAITPEQLTHAISQLSAAHIKLGTLAMHKGYMVASEVDEVCFLQTREDRRFGEIAIERGYLTEDQVRELLKTQIPDFLLFGQCLVDDGAISYEELQTLVLDYEAENEMYDIDLNIESKEKITQLIERFFLVAEVPITEYSIMYMELMFNNLVRFIGDDFTPLTPIPCDEFPVNYCVSQRIHGKVNCISRVDMEEDVAIAFASRYAKTTFTEFDEYVQASIEDFINLHNGLFMVNMSNEHSIELSLDPPSVDTTEALSLSSTTFILPVIYPFGAIHLIISYMLSMKIHILKRGLPLGKPSFLYLVYFLFQEISYYLWHLIHGTNGLVTYRSTADLFYGSGTSTREISLNLSINAETIFLCNRKHRQS